MIVGSLRVRLLDPRGASLKDKRQVVQSIKDRLRGALQRVRRGGRGPGPSADGGAGRGDGRGRGRPRPGDACSRSPSRCGGTRWPSSSTARWKCEKGRRTMKAHRTGSRGRGDPRGGQRDHPVRVARPARQDAGVTVTRAEVSGDLQHAKVFVSVMGSPQEQELAMHGLKHAAGFVQSKLAKPLADPLHAGRHVRAGPGREEEHRDDPPHQRGAGPDAPPAPAPDEDEPGAAEPAGSADGTAEEEPRKDSVG